MAKRVSTLTLSLFSIMTASGQAAYPRAAVVVDKDVEAIGLGELTAVALAVEPDLQLVERQHVQAVLQELQLSTACIRTGR